MKMEKQSCCFCSSIVSKGNIIDLNILNLLTFLIENIETSALENSTVCDGCLNKITETFEYKTRNSSKLLAEIKKEIDTEKPIVCQKCEKLCGQGDTVPLMDCVTEVGWLDFVNYLFVDQDSRLLENLQICYSCRISVSNIQDFLKLIYVYDQSKMKCDVDVCDDIKAAGNKLVQDKIEVKSEFEHFIVDDKTVIESVSENNKTEISDSDYINYADFKCKNEEFELKLEYGEDDNNPSTDRYEKGDGKEKTSSSDSNLTSSNNEEEEPKVNCQECNRLRLDMKVYNNAQTFKCAGCSQSFQKNHLDEYLLKHSKGNDIVTSKIHKCDKCSYATTRKNHLLIHKLKHGIQVEGLEKLKCQHCIYETYYNTNFMRHIKIHSISILNCTLCSKKFTERKNLDDHLLKIHKSKDNIISKIYECDKCNYLTTRTDGLLKHKLKHGKVEGFEKYKCLHCIYETYDKSNLIRHIKMHQNIRNIKCTLCSKQFTLRKYLDDHLLKVHESKDNVTSKIFECDKCTYSTTRHDLLLIHKLKHGKVEELKKYKCQYCIYESYSNNNLIRHTKMHNNIKDFKCTLCSKYFAVKRNLEDHLLKIHKSQNSVASQIHECDKCNYKTIKRDHLLKHKLKHGVKLELEIYKCQHCSYETYYKISLVKHIKAHKNIRDFKCSLCPKNFTQKIYLNDHLLKIHKSKDSVACKIHKCYICNYETTIKSHLLRHKLKHGIKDGLKKQKCQHCMYETYNKSNLNLHIKKHKRDCIT